MQLTFVKEEIGKTENIVVGVFEKGQLTAQAQKQGVTAADIQRQVPPPAPTSSAGQGTDSLNATAVR